MLRLIYLLVAALAFVPHSGCSAPAWWLAGEADDEERIGSLKELRGESNLDAIDLETSGAPRAKSGRAAEEPLDHNALIEATLRDSQTPSDRTDNTERDRSAGRANAPRAHQPAEASGAAAEREADDKLLADVRALDFDDPREEASALAALRATPAAHRKYLLRTMQASATMRQQHANREVAALPMEASAGDEAAARGGLPSRKSPAPARRQSEPTNDGQLAAHRHEGAEGETPNNVRQATHLENLAPRSTDHDLDRSRQRPADGAASPATAWQAQLERAITSLEAQLAHGKGGAEQAVLESKLRLLYLAADRRDEAIQSRVAGSTLEQQFWSSEIFGLATLLDADKQADAKQRAAAAVSHLQQAAERLGEFGGLVVKNLHFCSEVKGFGTFVTFPKDEFRLGQEVLLYCEVENFQSELQEKGHHTALKARYEVFNSSGERIADKDLGLKDEYCQNRRRDFFVPYFISMPKQAPPGNYQLKLTLEDIHAGQMAEATIEFAIKGQ